MHPDAIKAARSAANITFGEFDDVPELAGTALGQKAKTAKKWLNKDAVKHMTVDLLAQSDADGEVNGWLATIKVMLDALKDIPHLNYVRIGTRAPVVYPMRFFDDELIEVLRQFNRTKALYVPTHFNHPNEITPVAEKAILRLREAGITINNQAVLLRGVNDNVETLVTLMNELLRIGVNPYYLYQCMPVARVRHHFQVPLKEGVDIVDEARKQLDGYGKRFKFIIGHDIGKIEVCGRLGDKLIMKQLHTRPEYPEESSRMLVRQLTDKGGWLDDLPEIEL